MAVVRFLPHAARYFKKLKDKQLKKLYQEAIDLIADEVTANLDDENVEIILEILSKYVGNGGILIMVTHDNRIKKLQMKYI